MDKLVQKGAALVEHLQIVGAREIACRCGGQGEEWFAEDDVEAAIPYRYTMGSASAAHIFRYKISQVEYLPAKYAAAASSSKQ